MFLYFKYVEDFPDYLEEKLKSKNSEKGKIIENEVEAQIEKEIEEEENLMLDAIEDYMTEFGVKKVKIDTKKFKAFFDEWKSSN